MTELSDTTDRAQAAGERLASRPEVTHLVAAIAASMDDDVDDAAVALRSAVDDASWDAVERRIEVVCRALVADAELEPTRGPHPDPVEFDGADRSDRERWAASWNGLQVIARLLDRAGYPPEAAA